MMSEKHRFSLSTLKLIQPVSERNRLTAWENLEIRKRMNILMNVDPVVHNKLYELLR